MFLFTALTDILVEILTSVKRQVKELKCVYIGKKEIKLPLFTGDTIVHVEKSKESTKKLLLELISE